MLFVFFAACMLPICMANKGSKPHYVRPTVSKPKEVAISAPAGNAHVFNILTFFGKIRRKSSLIRLTRIQSSDLPPVRLVWTKCNFGVG